MKKLILLNLFSLIFLLAAGCSEEEKNGNENLCSLDSECSLANSFCNNGTCEGRPLCAESACPEILKECWSDGYCHKEKEPAKNDSDNLNNSADDFDRVAPGTTQENDN